MTYSSPEDRISPGDFHPLPGLQATVHTHTLPRSMLPLVDNQSGILLLRATAYVIKIQFDQRRSAAFYRAGPTIHVYYGIKLSLNPQPMLVAFSTTNTTLKTCFKHFHFRTSHDPRVKVFL